MLTLKQLLESDSLATIVAKLNQNFQVLSNSNGGPQGIRGPQGIPGLPGKMGPVGSTGAAGPTGTILGVLPFAPVINRAGVGPSVVTISAYGKVGPWPSSSYDWLLNYYGGNLGSIGGSGITPAAGEIFIDHNNGGYWKYLTSPDIDGAAYPGNLTGNPYQYAADTPYTYPDLGPGTSPIVGGDPGLYAGEGWYFYPGQDASAIGGGSVWTEDYTTYLQSHLQGGTGPYAQGPYDGSTVSPLTIPNARLVTKYGTVWITSGNDATDLGSDGYLTTSNIGKWGQGPGAIDAQPGRYNAGIDRLLFKMSLDGLSYQSNITARGYTGPATMALPNPGSAEMTESSDYPVTSNGIAFPTSPINYWVKPQYEVTLDKYSPLLFLSHRNDPTLSNYGTFGTLGIFIYTDTQTKDAVETGYEQPSDPYGSGTLNDNNVSKSIHLFSSRYAPDPMVMWDGNPARINSASTLNFGEMVLDFRRIIASNQYVCSLPTDMKLSSDYRPSANIYDESNSANTNKYRTFQGYISSINGKSLTGDTSQPYYWEYGLGAESPSINAGTHDLSSGTAGMLTRRTWYGSSVLATKSFDGAAPGENDYVRVAGMLERGRRFVTGNDSGGGEGEGSKSYFLSELIFYTSQFGLTGVTGGQQIDIDDVNAVANQHNSLPSLYASPFRNIGIGTFVGATAGADGGPLEPLAKFHVHVKPMDRSNDPVYDYKELGVGTGFLANLPTKVYSAAAFSGQLNDTNDKRAVTDILLGNVIPKTIEEISPAYNIVNGLAPLNSFRNAIRTESWKSSNVSTMHFGSSPISNFFSIGKNRVEDYKKEFQISLASLNPLAATLNGLDANTGVGIHNMFPRARFHMYGKNLYNEVEFGQELWTPGYTIAGGLVPLGLSGTYPFYGALANNAPSANQVIIDYLGSSYNYPVGIYEYQYYAFGATSGTGSTGSASPNAAVYPNREQLSPTRFAVPYGGAFLANRAYPSNAPGVTANGSYKHGGVANAFWDPQSYIGFNLYRDLSSASGESSIGQNINGDNPDTTRWILGTQGATANGHGNNGGAGIISSTQGELGIITIPRGRDGGRVYEQWEQRGLGTRDVLSHMKIVFDKNGNIAIGNAAGWDLDAYPSLTWNMTSGQVNYLPTIFNIPGTFPPLQANATNFGPVSGASTRRTTNRYGGVNYTNLSANYIETGATSTAALINKRATMSEYIRLEVAAEKSWSRDGRMLQKRGFGYPPNRTITITGSTLDNYIDVDFSAWSLQSIANASMSSWVLTTDNEGRIINAVINISITSIEQGEYFLSELPNSVFKTIVFPHPTEFNAGPSGGTPGPLNYLITGPAYNAPAGAIAAEWWGMSNDFPTASSDTIVTVPINDGDFYVSALTAYAIPTTDLRGSANIRLNNFVYGEGFGFNGGSQAGSNDSIVNIDYTKELVQQKRQESPKIILSFLEKTPTATRTNMGVQTGVGTTPYLKVNTVIASAQNETSLREYWIPKTDNTGGTFMVFTDFLGQKEKDVRFNETPINNTGLFLEEVVTQEFLAGYQLYRDIPVRVTSIQQKSTVGPYNLLPKLDYDAPLYNYLQTLPSPWAGVTPVNMYPGFVRYYNRAYNKLGAPAYFLSSEYGEIVRGSSPAAATVVQTQADSIKHYTTFNIYPTPQTGSPGAGTCSTTNEDDEIVLRFGYRTGSEISTLITSEQAPRTAGSGCSDFNMFITEDSVQTPGGFNGTVVNKSNAGGDINHFCFRRKTNPFPKPFPENPAGVKITITLSANTRIGANTYELDWFSHLGIRLLYGQYTQEDFNDGLVSNHRGTRVTVNSPLGVAEPNDKVVAYFPIVSTYDNHGGKRGVSINGTDTIYMSWNQWTAGQDFTNKEYWFLNAAFLSYGQDDLNDWYVPNIQVSANDDSCFICSKFEVKFEYIWPEGSQGISEQNTAVSVGNASSIRRNIDKYYEIHKPTISYQPQWGDTAGVDNQATQIRVKRINSEYALVDYNITVKVNNPAVLSTYPGDPSSYIDFCSPRYTQYLRFLYIPDGNGLAGQSKRVYDDDLSLINWSSYKNWLPGTAIVGDDIYSDSTDSTIGLASVYPPSIGENIRCMTSDWSPFFNDNFSDSPFTYEDMYFSPMTWNGNILEMVSYAAYNATSFYNYVEEAVGKGNTRFSTLNRPLRSFYSAQGFTANGSSEDYARNTAYAAFGSDLRILGFAYSLFPYTYSQDGIANARLGTSGNAGVGKQLAFVGYLGSMYALWRNESFLRNKNTQWRILPAQPYQSSDTTSDNDQPNRSFYLEVQLSTPILHVDTPLGTSFYGQKSFADTVTPYRYLTLNGQAIVKFAETDTVIRPYFEISSGQFF